MMRSLYSAVSGLKTHQTKMDVIGNNVSNVNTVAFKGTSVTFNEIMYQTVSGATGANGTTGLGGKNAKQIGLGVAMGATNVNITSAGAAETTGRGLDIRLTDKSTTNFFVVNNGAENVFTRAGSFYLDGAGNLAMTSTGYTVMGWQIDPVTGEIRKDRVSALQPMQEKFMTSNAEATKNGTVSGVLDKNDTNINSDTGYAMLMQFYDNLGYSYTAKFSVKVADAANEDYTVELTDILDSNDKSVLKEYLAANPGSSVADIFGKNTTSTKNFNPVDSRYKYTTTAIPGTTIPANSYYVETKTFNASGTEIPVYTPVTMDTTPGSATFGQYSVPEIKYFATAADQASGTESTIPGVGLDPANPSKLTEFFGISQAQLDYLNAAGSPTAVISAAGQFSLTSPTVNYTLKFDKDKGTFSYVDAAGMESVNLNLTNTLGGKFADISIDFSQCKSSDNGGKGTLGLDPGAKDKTTGKGKALGALTDVAIDGNGKVYCSYDNGNTTLVGQIAVAQFANASGLEKVGDNCYKTTLNSGDFDGVGMEISADGSSMSTGELEMSNVDLASEFTQMIITQRGYQANSRVITTSDSLLEELINLKR